MQRRIFQTDDCRRPSISMKIQHPTSSDCSSSEGVHHSKTRSCFSFHAVFVFAFFVAVAAGAMAGDPVEPLEAHILNLIDHMLYNDALVIAEAYHARANTEESLHLYVKCLMLLRRYKAVFGLLRNQKLSSARIRYIYARCCYEIGEYKDAEDALREPRVTDRVELHRSFQGTTSKAVAHLLLGQILVETGSGTDNGSKNEFRLSCKENPFIHSAMKGFCDVNRSAADDISKLLIEEFKTLRQQFIAEQQQMQENPKRVRKALVDRPPFAVTSSRSNRTKEVLPLAQRNSYRVVGENLLKKKKIASTVARNPVEDPILGDVIDYFIRVAVVQRFLSRYESKKAKKAMQVGFRQECFQGTSIVMEMNARASFEESDYKQVVDIMEDFRNRYPFNPCGIDVMSTALWHLQDAHKLSGLAKSMMTDLDDTPEAWCVNGNCFSVQKKHDTAVECLSRATTINPRFSYAYSLLGHELIDMEETERAIEAFSSALRYSPNDYRAYYGLALVHFKRDENEEAKKMLNIAIQINQNSTTLLCQLAKVEQRLGSPQRADVILRKAMKLNPSNVAVRYHYADNLLALEKTNEALDVLEKLKQESPDEPNIYNLIGRIHKKLHNNHLSQMNINWAQTLDPRGEQQHSVLSERHFGDEEMCRSGPS
ncbi:hypothetical protein L596_010309 [Steinernema carpocapsae]|uniref:Cell division cycle protein 27 homolog n=1 Tax=Steinernema carpocapsae TaxID=34508 RepID=A0A4U5PIP1_STECR|nr:hypothetical protein L596_010309 [Steinernema carpocapsae]